MATDEDSRRSPAARRHAFSATPWESQVGYSRAIRAGNQIFVTGTVAAVRERRRRRRVDRENQPGVEMS